MYKINRKRLIIALIESFMKILLSILLLLWGTTGLETQNIPSGEGSIGVYIIWSLGILIAITGVKEILNYRREMKRFDYLERNGKLVRGLKYTVIVTRKTSKRKILNVAVDYELESGSFVKLVANWRYYFLANKGRVDVDLLIDPNDLNNYYIDFDIEEV